MGQEVVVNEKVIVASIVEWTDNRGTIMYKLYTAVIAEYNHTHQTT